MVKKTNISATVPIEVYQWLKAEEINISEEVSNFLSELKVKNDVPKVRIAKLDEEMDKIMKKKDVVLMELQTTIEEGKRIEREEAQKLKDEIERKEKDKINKYIGLLEELQKHSGWENFVNNYEELTMEEIVTYNEELTKDGINTRGWGNLREIMKVFTKEQLKGGVVLLEKEDVSGAKVEELS